MDTWSKEMANDCTIEKTVDFISKRWVLLILLELSKSQDSKLRYSELKRKLPGITGKILSSRLKELEDEGLLHKTVSTKTIPIRCEYSLTTQGIKFFKVIKSIKSWALSCRVSNKYCECTSCKDCKL